MAGPLALQFHVELHPGLQPGLGKRPGRCPFYPDVTDKMSFTALRQAAGIWA